jgi:hypothetical protein
VKVEVKRKVGGECFDRITPPCGAGRMFRIRETPKEIGLILNFAETTVEVKRKVRDLKTLDQQY